MLSEDQGRIFEVGFNIGILAYFQQNQLGQNWVDFYRVDLEQLKFRKILKPLIARANAISQLDQDIVTNWSEFLLLRGFLGGLNFMGEYLKSTHWKLDKLEVLYYQCNFSDENSINTYNKSERTSLNQILNCFSDNVNKLTEDEIEIILNRYLDKGEFLKADTLILFCYNQREYRILALDTSVFSLKSEQDLTNLEFVGLIKSKLIRELNYLRSKSVFSQLRIDTGEGNDLAGLFTSGLKEYFTAFKYQDKESAKLIQAGGYAYSFWTFLEEKGILPHEAKLVISAVGYSDRGISTITVNRENIPLLAPCYEIYKDDSSPTEIQVARQKVLELIKREANRSFKGGKQFINALSNIPVNQTTVITHQEQLEDFCNTVGKIPPNLATQLQLNPNLDLRNAHNELIKKALLSEHLYVFLTGNPGIGKTTAIADFLKEHLEEGFLFFYVSPRKQVNLDILEKFTNPSTGELCDPRLFCLNTNSNIIADNAGKTTVQYSSMQIQDEFYKKTVNFIPSKQNITRRSKLNSQVQRQSETSLQTVPPNTHAVLASICQGIYAVIEENISNQIVASVSIQSLKKTINGDTLEHFDKIFKGAYNKKLGKPNPEKMRQLSRRIKHIFIMIDEITGDDSGVEFLSRINDIFKTYELVDQRYGFNPKIIVADASIVEQDVIKQHLNDTTPEPDKIFFRKAKTTGAALSVEEFKFKRSNAIAINANSYPASKLNFTYKVVINTQPFVEKDRLRLDKDDLIETLQAEIIKDINQLWDKEGQILVYIQSKPRLQQLIEQIGKSRDKFKPQEDYLEVHANLSEPEKKAVQTYKNDVKVIFMTSSGSRGLSFPKVNSILVDIPRFQVEKNLMEVIQVIYRGRGDKQLDQLEKQLIFYLGEKAVYNQDEPQISLQESSLNILNLLLILKAAILTRIVGNGIIGRHDCLIIPIGGKSVSAAGESFSLQLANLLRELKQESHRKPSDVRLKRVYEQFRQLLNNTDFKLYPSHDNNVKPQLSYLALQKRLNSEFSDLINQGFDKLIKFGVLERGYLCGSLLIVPTAENKIAETYRIHLDKLLNLTSNLLKDLQTIGSSQDYHDNLRYATKNAIDLVKKLKEPTERSQQLEQLSQRADQYYAFPLFTFLNGDAIKEYLSQEEEFENNKFRDILEMYIRHLYSVGNMLPIGDGYREFPFVVFNSYSLEEIREKFFTERYLLNSHELNIVNLILSK